MLVQGWGVVPKLVLDPPWACSCIPAHSHSFAHKHLGVSGFTWSVFPSHCPPHPQEWVSCDTGRPQVHNTSITLGVELQPHSLAVVNNGLMWFSRRLWGVGPGRPGGAGSGE